MNRRGNRSVLIVLMIVAFAGAMVWAQTAWAQGPGGHHMGGPHGQIMKQLTEEQRQQVRETIQKLRDEGAAPEEIRAAVDALLDEWGIERPEGEPGFKGPHGQRPHLTKEQREQLHSLIKEMKEQGATREQIRTKVDSLFREWGVPPRRFHHGRRGHAFRRLMRDLNEDQRAELKAKLKELREQKVSRKEAYEAIAALFESWGLEAPPPRGLADLLTREQLKTVHDKVKEMREQGATREEIHEAVQALLDEWGIVVPEGVWPRGPKLTEEQRKTLRETVKNLREQGATREEIREAVKALFDEWGIEPPRHGRHGFHGHKAQRWHRFFRGLNEEQRQTLRQTIRSLREQGASRKEILETIKELRQQWLNENPESDAPTLQGEGKIKAMNYPNPFNPTTQITFSLEEPGHVMLQIYNARGQLIRTLLNEQRSKGTHQVTWDGRNEQGVVVPSGLYFYKITSGEETLTKRMLFMK